VWRFLKKLKLELSNDLATLLPGLHPKEVKGADDWGEEEQGGVV
jgi:hypothetical protein